MSSNNVETETETEKLTLTPIQIEIAPVEWLRERLLNVCYRREAFTLALMEDDALFDATIVLIKRVERIDAIFSAARGY